MTRHELREHCFKVLFCTGFYPEEEADEQILRYFEQPEEDETDEHGAIRMLHAVELDDAEEAEVRDRADTVLAALPDIDRRLMEVTEGWKQDRIGRVERTILRLAAYEILWDDQVPERVAINEAVELAKKFGGDEAPAFVNGILGKMVNSPRQQEQAERGQAEEVGGPKDKEAGKTTIEKRDKGRSVVFHKPGK